MNLRPTILEDIDSIMEWVNDPKVLELFANFNPVTKEEEMKFLTSLLESTTDKTYTVETISGSYVGQVSINKIYWPAKNGRLSIVIHPNARGMGLIRTIIPAVEEKAWEIGLHKLWLMVRVDNVKGQKLYKDLGFIREAILTDEYVVPETGEFIDMIRMYKINPNE